MANMLWGQWGGYFQLENDSVDETDFKSNMIRFIVVESMDSTTLTLGVFMLILQIYIN